MSRMPVRGAWVVLAFTMACGGAASSRPSGSLPDAAPESASPSSDAGPSVTCPDHPLLLAEPFWTNPARMAGQVGDMVVANGDVYFTLSVEARFSKASSTLWSVPAGGGPSRMVAALSGVENGMVTTSAGLLIAEYGGESAEIVELPFSGGPVATIAWTDGAVGSLVADGANAYFVDADGTKKVALAAAGSMDAGAVELLTAQKGTLALAGADVIVADPTGGNVFSVPQAGGALTTLAANQPGAASPCVCGAGGLCWTTTYPCAEQDAATCLPSGMFGEAAIVNLATGGAPVTLVRDALFYPPSDVVFDGTDFFVISAEDVSSDGPLTRVPLSGGAPVQIGRADAVQSVDGCLFTLDYDNGLFVEPSTYTP